MSSYTPVHLHIHSYTTIYSFIHFYIHSYTTIYIHILSYTVILTHIHPYAFIYIHIPSHSFIHFHIHSYTTIYIHIPSKFQCHELSIDICRRSATADRNIKLNLASRQQPACTFVQNATESAAQESGSYHTKEVIDRLGYSYVVTDAKLQGRPVLVFGIRERRTEKSLWCWPTGQRIKMAPYKIRNGGMLVGKFQLNLNSGTTSNNLVLHFCSDAFSAETWQFCQNI